MKKKGKNLEWREDEEMSERKKNHEREKREKKRRGKGINLEGVKYRKEEVGEQERRWKAKKNETKKKRLFDFQCFTRSFQGEEFWRKNNKNPNQEERRSSLGWPIKLLKVTLL